MKGNAVTSPASLRKYLNKDAAPIRMHNAFREFFFYSCIRVAKLPRPICPFWATVYGRNLSGFGGTTGFAFFFRFVGDA